MQIEKIRILFFWWIQLYFYSFFLYCQKIKIIWQLKLYNFFTRLFKTVATGTKNLPECSGRFFIFEILLFDFFQTSRLPSEFSNKGDIFPTNFERTKNLDFRNSRRINRECFFDTDSINILANDDGFLEFCFPMSLDDESTKFLDTFLVSFFDFLVNFDFHTGSYFWSLVCYEIPLDSLNEC